MLAINIKSGEYFTIGDNIVVQIFDGASHDVHRVRVDAPRELRILRGAVLEREEERPDGVLDDLPRRRSAAYKRRMPTQLEKLEAKREYFDGKRREAEEEKATFIRDMRALLDREEPSPLTEAMRSRLEAFANSEIIV